MVSWEVGEKERLDLLSKRSFSRGPVHVGCKPACIGGKQETAKVSRQKPVMEKAVMAG